MYSSDHIKMTNTLRSRSGMLKGRSCAWFKRRGSRRARLVVKAQLIRAERRDDWDAYTYVSGYGVTAWNVI